MVSGYTEFLAQKRAVVSSDGPVCAADDVHPLLHEWQRHLVAWAVRTGRAALWADAGLGKTLMQLEWARLVTHRPVLLLAPLAVAHQTVAEAGRVGVAATYVRDQAAVTGPGVWVTNYEMLSHFDAGEFGAVVLDEASVLKQSDGRTRTQLIEWAAPVPYRLACTATPAPNDPEELTNQAEFLGRMRRADMLAAYFVHDDEGWRLKGHARQPLIRWMSSWAIAIRKPSDLGWPDEGYNLPGLELFQHLVSVEIEAEGQLFATDLGGVGGRAQIRRHTLDQRCERALEVVAREPGEQWVIWCGLNDEQDHLLKRLGEDCRSIDGRTPLEDRVEFNRAWIRGDFRVLLVKAGMYSFGMNWQHCARMAFVGLSDSYEAYYQALRRCHRYGQTRVVHAHIVLSEIEASIYANVRRKERSAAGITEELVREMTATHRYRDDLE